MFATLPPLALLLGLAGLLPFAACAVLALQTDSPAPWLAALIGYGAVILAFLGGVHWGFVLGAEAPARRRERLALGVVPSLLGWAALLLQQFLPPEVSLAVLIAGVLGTVTMEARWRAAGLVPAGYMALRWLLSLLVGAVLTTVLVLRLIGARLVF